MPEKILLFYSIPVKEDLEYKLKLRVGDGQPGDINVYYHEFSYDKEPESNNPEYETSLGNGANLRDRKLILTSYVKNENANTDYVSVRLFINEDEVYPQSMDGSKDSNIISNAPDGQEYYFKHKIVFL